MAVAGTPSPLRTTPAAALRTTRPACVKAPPSATELSDALFTTAAQVRDAALLNLQVLPDTLLAGLLLFALLLQSLPIATLALTMAAVAPAHRRFAAALAALVPGLTGVPDGCSGRFTSISVNLEAPDMDPVAVWPSYYTTFIGTLAAYIGMMPFTYAGELAKDPARASAVYGGLFVLAALAAVALVYRLSTCDSAASTLVGLACGAVLGAVAHAALAYGSERRLTNLLNMPLLA